MACVIVLSSPSAHDVVHGVVQFGIGIFENVEIVAQAEQLVVVDAAQAEITKVVVSRIVLLMMMEIVILGLGGGQDGHGARRRCLFVNHFDFHGQLLLLLLLHERLLLLLWLLLGLHVLRLLFLLHRHWMETGLHRLLLWLHDSTWVHLPYAPRVYVLLHILLLLLRMKLLLVNWTNRTLHLLLLLMLLLLLHQHHSHPGIG